MSSFLGFMSNAELMELAHLWMEDGERLSMTGLSSCKLHNLSRV